MLLNSYFLLIILFLFIIGKEEPVIMVNSMLITACYFYMISIIRKENRESSLLCDGRTYYCLIMYAYTIIAPIYAMMVGFNNGGVVLYMNNVGMSLFDKATLLGLLFSVGQAVGFYIHHRKHNANQVCTVVDNELTQRQTKQLMIVWLFVCVISTYFFLKPFFYGGFNLLSNGSFILDLDRNAYHPGVLGLIESTLWPIAIMPVSTAAVIYYYFKLDSKLTKKIIVVILISLIQFFIAYYTTRRAYAITIILCLVIIYLKYYYKEKAHAPRILLITIAVFFIVFYLQDVLWRSVTEVNSAADTLLLFDGFPPYDALLTALQEGNNTGMFSNIIYGLFRPIPILGKYLVELFNIDSSAAPLYHWLAARYATYDFGGGIACLPELESYLIGGSVFTAISGLIYALVFGKKRSGVLELIFVIISFSAARGSIQITLTLLWQCVFIGYMLYDKLLGRKL